MEEGIIHRNGDYALRYKHFIVTQKDEEGNEILIDKIGEKEDGLEIVKFNTRYKWPYPIANFVKSKEGIYELHEFANSFSDPEVNRNIVFELYDYAREFIRQEKSKNMKEVKTYFYPAGDMYTNQEKEDFYSELKRIKNEAYDEGFHYESFYAVTTFFLPGEEIEYRFNDDLGIPYSLVYKEEA